MTDGEPVAIKMQRKVRKVEAGVAAINKMLAEITRLQAENASLREQVEKAREALETFADRADQWALNGDSARVSVRLGDLRRARASYIAIRHLKDKEERG